MGFELLTDPAVTGQARDVVLSDAMMGYLQFVAGIPVNGNRWLYSDKPYKLATPALSVINQWQLALDSGDLPALYCEPRAGTSAIRDHASVASGTGRGFTSMAADAWYRDAASWTVEQRCACPA